MRKLDQGEIRIRLSTRLTGCRASLRVRHNPVSMSHCATTKHPAKNMAVEWVCGGAGMGRNSLMPKMLSRKTLLQVSRRGQPSLAMVWASKKAAFAYLPMAFCAALAAEASQALCTLAVESLALSLGIRHVDVGVVDGPAKRRMGVARGDEPMMMSGEMRWQG